MLHICSRDSENSTYTGNRNVILAKHRLQLPDDGLCKPKHVGATFIIMIVKYNLYALVGQIKNLKPNSIQ